MDGKLEAITAPLDFRVLQLWKSKMQNTSKKITVNEISSLKVWKKVLFSIIFSSLTYDF